MKNQYVTLCAAEMGLLESPAIARKSLVPKVAIGSAYVAPKRERHTATGYEGYNPRFDSDSLAMQGAFLPKPLGVISDARATWRDVAWWILGSVFLIVFFGLLAYC